MGTIQAYGLGVYCYFSANSGVVAANAFTSASGSGIGRHDMVTVSPGGTGTIRYVINAVGATVNSSNTVADPTGYP